MVDNGTTTQSFNDEPIVRSASIILGRHFNNAFLHQEQLVCYVVFLAQKLAFLVSFSLHAKYQLLLGRHGQILKVLDLVHLHFDELGHLVIILEYLLFEVIRHVVKDLLKFVEG